MLTESDAKKKWCPFVRVVPFTVANCIASRCMAWQWVKAEDSPDGEHPHHWPDLIPYHDADTPRRLKRFGCCGLAGKDTP